MAIEWEKRPNRNGSLAATDQAKFQELYVEYAAKVRYLAYRSLRDLDLAEDVVQETFLRVHRAFAQIDPDRPIWPWLSAIARRLCVDMQRRRRTHPEKPSADIADDGLGIAQPIEDGPEDQVLTGEQRGAITAVLASMFPRYRRILVLRDLEGWRYEEIADHENLSLPAVKSVILRARRTFREHYQSMFGDQGLNVLAWPVVGSALARLRALRARAETAAGTSTGVSSALQMAAVNLAAVATLVSLSSGASPSVAASARPGGLPDAQAVLDSTVTVSGTAASPDRDAVQSNASAPSGMRRGGGKHDPAAKAKLEGDIDQRDDKIVVRLDRDVEVLGVVRSPRQDVVTVHCGSRDHYTYEPCRDAASKAND